MLKKKLPHVALTLLLASTALLLVPARAQEKTIKIGIELQETHPQGIGAAKFAEILEKKSGGKLKAKVFYSGTLGDSLRMVSALKGGVLEATIPATAILAGDIKEFGLFDLPFLFGSEAEVDAVLDGAPGKNLLAKLPSKGLVGLCYWEIGFRHLTNNSRPISRVEEIDGLKIRVIQNAAYREMFKALGANAVPMAFTEVYNALETRTIDAQESPLTIIQSARFNEVQKYLTLTAHTYTPIVFLVSKIFWDKLSPAEQTVMRESCEESRDYQRIVNRQMNGNILNSLKKAGMQVTALTIAEQEKMRMKVKPVADKFANEYGEAAYKEMNAEISKVRKSH